MKSKMTSMLNLVHSLGGMRGAAALLAGLMIALAVPASAMTIGISNGILIAGTEPGDGNQVFEPTIAGSNLVLPNLTADIVTPGCTGVGTITCLIAGFQELVILGGDGDDLIDLSSINGLTFAITVLGLAGNDVLIGTPGEVNLFGGAGDDVIVLAHGNCASPGAGDDLVIRSLRAGCAIEDGPEPVFAPLPREVVGVPEPSDFWLFGIGLVALAATRTSVRLDNVELYVWDCNHPESPNCKLVFKNNGGRLDYQYFAASSTALFSSRDGLTLGMMTNGDYMLADHDMPFSGPLGLTNFILDFLLSPADLQITDAQGLKTGNYGGKIYAEIPGSLPCYLVPKAYLLPSDAALERRIAGTGRGRYTYNSITPNGGSVVLQGVTTAAGQVDVLSMNPDQTELRFTPAVAKKFDMTVAKRVGDQLRAMAISGIGGNRNAEFRFNTSAELGFANLVNAGGNRKVGIQTMVLDKQGKLTQKPRVTSVNMSANSELTMEMLDWNLLDSSVPVVKKH